MPIFGMGSTPTKGTSPVSPLQSPRIWPIGTSWICFQQLSPGLFSRSKFNALPRFLGRALLRLWAPSGLEKLVEHERCPFRDSSETTSFGFVTGSYELLSGLFRKELDGDFAPIGPELQLQRNES